MEEAAILPEGPARAEALHAAVAEWCVRDSAAGFAWIAGRADGAERLSLRMAVCQRLMTQDPTLALATAGERGVLEENPDFGMHLVSEWAARDANGAIAWIKSQNEEDTARTDWIAAVSLAQAEEGRYEAAVSLALEEIPDEARETVIVGIVNRWAQKDLVAARAWVETFPLDDPMRGKAFAELEAIKAGRELLSASLEKK